MAYSRSRNRSRSRGAKNAPMVASPHTPILTVGVLVAVGLSCFGLPGMPVLLAAVTVAWLAARAPQLTGTDPWKRTCANTPAEQRRDTSYKWMRSWFRHLSRNLDPRNPMTEVAMHGYAWRCRTVHGARKRRFFIPITAPIPHNHAFPYIIVRIVADHGTRSPKRRKNRGNSVVTSQKTKRQ